MVLASCSIQNTDDADFADGHAYCLWRQKEEAQVVLMQYKDFIFQQEDYCFCVFVSG